MLPIGARREEREVSLPFLLWVDQTKLALQGYEEVTVPPAKVVPPRATERLIRVADLDPLARGSFPVSREIHQDFQMLRLSRVTHH